MPNGVLAQRFTDDASDDPSAVGQREAWRERLGRYVLTVGGIEPRKGTIDLVDAYHTLRQRLPDVRLVIAGGETLFDYRDYRASFEHRCADLGVAPVISVRSKTANCRVWSPRVRCLPSRRPRRVSGWPRWRRTPDPTVPVASAAAFGAAGRQSTAGRVMPAL
jgi:glycosyltransferase involved in cell wall biosynthesis